MISIRMRITEPGCTTSLQTLLLNGACVLHSTCNEEKSNQCPSQCLERIALLFFDDREQSFTGHGICMCLWSGADGLHEHSKQLSKRSETVQPGPQDPWDSPPWDRQFDEILGRSLEISGRGSGLCIGTLCSIPWRAKISDPRATVRNGNALQDNLAAIVDLLTWCPCVLPLQRSSFQNRERHIQYSTPLEVEYYPTTWASPNSE